VRDVFGFSDDRAVARLAGVEEFGAPRRPEQWAEEVSEGLIAALGPA